jgi:dimethylamine/trimethylamine dehydrogenase
VSYVTPAGHPSAWSIMSNEQPQVHRALFAGGIALHTLARVVGFARGELHLERQFTNVPLVLPCGSLIIVGARLAEDTLQRALAARADELTAAGIRSVTAIGDALAPGAIVHAVYSGHRYARELDAEPDGAGARRDAPLPRLA